MARRRLLAAAGAIVLLAYVPATAWAQPAQTPSQAPHNTRFVEIQNILGFSGFFNLGQGTVRMLVLLPPSCKDCVEMFHEVRRIMDETTTKRLRAFIVFMPTSEADTRSLALTIPGDFVEYRVSYFWDPNFAVAKELGKIAGPHDPTHGACLLFDTGSVVKDKPDEPTLWLSPHGGEDPAFDAGLLNERVHELLTRFQEKQRNQGDAAE